MMNPVLEETVRIFIELNGGDRMSSKLICMIGLVVLALCAATAFAQDSSLRVVGAGSVQVPADTVIIEISAQNSNNNSTLAAKANSGVLEQTEKSLIAAGVKEEEIMPDRPKGYMTYHKLVCNTVNNTTSCQNVVTNAATEQMIIKLKSSDEKRTQKVIDAARSAGVDAAIIGYALSDSEKAVDEARKKALEDARAKAEEYASAYGLSLGKIMEIEEPAYPDIEIGPSYGWGWNMPERMNRHMFWMEPFPRMHRFWASDYWEEDYIPEGMAEVTAYVSVTYKV